MGTQLNKLSLAPAPKIITKKKIETEPVVDEAEGGIPIIEYEFIKTRLATAKDKLRALKNKVEKTQKKQRERALAEKYSNNPEYEINGIFLNSNLI